MSCFLEFPMYKDEVGSGAYAEDGIVQRALREAIEQHFPEMYLIGRRLHVRIYLPRPLRTVCTARTWTTTATLGTVWQRSAVCPRYRPERIWWPRPI